MEFYSTHLYTHIPNLFGLAALKTGERLIQEPIAAQPPNATSSRLYAYRASPLPSPVPWRRPHTASQSEQLTWYAYIQSLTYYQALSCHLSYDPLPVDVLWYGGLFNYIFDNEETIISVLYHLRYDTATEEELCRILCEIVEICTTPSESMMTALTFTISSILRAHGMAVCRRVLSSSLCHAPCRTLQDLLLGSGASSELALDLSGDNVLVRAHVAAALDVEGDVMRYVSRRHLGGVDLNATLANRLNVKTQTLLGMAVVGGHVSMVEMLIDCGCHDDSVLDIAVHYAYRDVIDLLISRGYKLTESVWNHVLSVQHYVNIAGKVPVDDHTIRRLGMAHHTSVICHLTDNQLAKLDSQYSPIVNLHSIRDINQLVVRGYDINSAPEGDTVLHAACRYRDAALVRYSLDVGGDCNVTDDHGMTPLHVACCMGDDVIINMLIIAYPGAQYIKDSRGHVPDYYKRKRLRGQDTESIVMPAEYCVLL